jgi:hypothetical protein|tara:strand:- start:22599 stop:22721 length:123 start_codon:yes stop_codon:yes gene_type:complete
MPDIYVIADPISNALFVYFAGFAVVAAVGWVISKLAGRSK